MDLLVSSSFRVSREEYGMQFKLFPNEMTISMDFFATLRLRAFALKFLYSGKNRMEKTQRRRVPQAPPVQPFVEAQLAKHWHSQRHPNF